jgi:CRP-like cAMP-binding protein
LDGLPAQIEWRVELPTTLAALDGHFLRVAACHESVAAALIDRLTLRSRLLALQAALTTVSPLEERVLLGLWHVANRWGRVTADGVAIPFPLTHRVIAELVGATRPSVSSAISRLARQGLAKQARGGWLLRNRPSGGESDNGPLEEPAGDAGGAPQRWATQAGRPAKKLRSRSG